MKFDFIATNDHLTINAEGVEETSTAFEVAMGTVFKGDKGDKGDLGQGYSNKGDWEAGTTYKPYDVVKHLNSVYVCLVENTNNAPSLENTDWVVWIDSSIMVNTTAIKQVSGTSTTDVMSQKAVTDELDVKADHGYDAEETPKTLKEVDDNLVQLESEVGDTPQSVKVQRTTFYKEGFVNKSDGLIRSSIGLKVTDFIPITPDAPIIIKGYDSNNSDNSAICVFYDEKREIITSYTSGVQGVLTITISPENIPQNAKYIRSTARISTVDAYVQVAISDVVSRIDAFIKEGGAQNYVLGQPLEVQESSNANGWYSSKPIPKLNAKTLNIKGSFNNTSAVLYYDFLGNIIKTTNGEGSSVQAQTIIDSVPDNCYYFIIRSAFSLATVTVVETSSNNEAETQLRDNVLKVISNYTSVQNQEISDASDVGNGWYRTTLLAIPDNCQLKYNGITREAATALEFFNVFKISIGVVNGSGAQSIKVIEVEPPQGTAFVQATYIGGAGSLIISEKGKSSFINHSSAEYFEKRGVIRKYSNNLINEPDSILASTNYGQSNASHTMRLDDTVRRICFDVVLPKSINKSGATTRIVTIRPIGEGGAYFNFDAVYGIPQQIKSTSGHPSSQTTWSPFPQTLSGAIATDYYRQNRWSENRDSLGDRVFSMWLKGTSSSENEPAKEDVVSRSAYLETIQDIYIEIVDDTFTIGRDGIGEDDLPFNDGTTSIIFSTSLKNNGEYKTAIALYEEITANNLVDFEVKFFALTNNLSCEDIVQYGKFKLVGKFNQRSGAGEADALLYDAFPLFIYASNREMRLTVDVVITQGESATTYVNGKKNTSLSVYTAKTFNLDINQGITGCKVENLEVFYNSIGDVEIIGKRIASERTPLIFGLMGHGLEDKYKNVSSLATSVPKMIALSKNLRERGYNMLSADDLSGYYNGFKKLPAKNAFIITDDYRLIEWMYSNTDVRSSFHQMGLKIIFAMIINRCINNNLDKNFILSAIQNGCSFVSHSYYHDVEVDKKSSISLYYELQKAKEYMNENYFNQNVFVFPWHGGFRHPEVMLEYCGYSIGVDSGTGTQEAAQNSKFSNPFRLNRFNIDDATVMPQF